MGKARKPIVIDDLGQIEELQVDDYLDIPESITKTAGTNIQKGDYCYVGNDGKAYLSKSDADSTAYVDLVALENITSGQSGEFSIASNDVPLPTGQTSTAGTVLFLSDINAGKAESAPVTTSNHYLIQTGVALTSTTQIFAPQRRIKRY